MQNTWSQSILSDLEDYFGIAEDEDIHLIRAYLHQNKAASVKLPNGKYIIGVDLDAIDNEAELKCCVAHEIGHVKTDTFYEEGTKHDRYSAEYDADRWAVMYCVPFKEYLTAIGEGVRDVWGLSEYFGITVKSAIKVAEFYESKFLEYIRIAKEVNV